MERVQSTLTGAIVKCCLDFDRRKKQFSKRAEGEMVDRDVQQIGQS